MSVEYPYLLGTTPVGSTISGTLTPGTSTQVFTIERTPGQNLSFEELNSRRFSGVFRLYGLGSQFISSRSLGFDFEVTLPGNGQYLLMLEGTPSEVVDYSFQVV